jgi:hypothetical protein
LTQLFGFAQLDFAGTLLVADGRYVLREGDKERVLVIETLGAPPAPRRRRRRPRDVDGDATPETLPLARTTVVLASERFASANEASDWLQGAVATEEAIDSLVDEAIDLINRALHAHGVASGDPHLQALTPRLAVATRLGYGSGEEVADSSFSAAHEVDVRTGGSATRRQQRAEELRPQERLAAVLGGRERFDACETLVLRARADLDAGRTREAALQLRVGLEALLAELKGALDDPGHEEDMATLGSRRHEAGELANLALGGDLNAEQAQSVGELVETCERVLRRRRVLRG